MKYSISRNRFSHRTLPAISKTPLKLAATLAALLLPLLPAAAAPPPTVVLESFSYSSGNLNGANGGTGWSTAWATTYGHGGNFNVDSTGFTYSNLTTSGGRIVWGSGTGTSGTSGISQGERFLTTALESGVVWVQFLANLESGTSGGGTPMLRLNHNNVGTGAFGGNGGTYTSKMSILDASLTPKSDGTSSTSANLNTLNLVLVKIDHSASLTQMWVNPNLSTFNHDNPPAADASYAGLAPKFNSIALVTRSPGSFDEIRVMHTAANGNPTITDIADQTIDEDTATSALAFTIGDAETAAASLTVTGNSSNTTLVPVDNIVFGGSGANRTVTVTPVADAHGSATITVTVSDGSLTASDTFTLTVSPVDDAPRFALSTSQLLYETITPTRVLNNIVYSVDNLATLGSTPFNRVRYRMETTVSGVVRYADVSFDAWSGLTAAALKVPTPNATATIQRNVDNMTVDSNYPGVVNAHSQTGRLEIWNWNYSPGATGGVGGSSTTYDFDDTSAGNNAYGSFQVHNLSSTPKQTVLAWNNHGNANPDVGFGNRPTGDPDWTFSGASGLGTTNWKLQIYIGDAGLPSQFLVTEDIAGNLLFSGVPFAEVDGQSLTVTLSVLDGTITGNAGTGVTVGGTATERTFTGAAADLNAYFTTAGKITYLGSPNNTASRTLTITAFDGSLSTTHDSTINFTPVNDAPTDIALTSASILENNLANATVGTLSATDPDAGDSHIFTLVSGDGSTDNASFTISGNSLRITPNADYETKNSYAIRVRATDNGTGALYFEKAFTISITNANESPVGLALSATAVTENVPANTTIGAFTTTDPDAGDSFTYTLVDGSGDDDNTAFNILGDALRITAPPNYATQSSFTVRVRTTDAGGLFFDKAFVIEVIAPEITVEESAALIASGGGRSFGTVAIGSSTSRTFTIRNIGSADLTDVAAAITGDHAGDFSLTSSPASTVSAPGGETSFSVKFTPSAAGSRTALLTIASNDDDEDSFEIHLSGLSGPSASALAFDGVNDTLEIPADAEFNTPTFTIEGWVKPDSTMPEWARLWGTENNQGDLIIKTGAENRFSFAPVIDGEFAYVHAPAKWVSGRWYHVAGVVDHTMIRLFVDGVQVAARAKSSPWLGDAGKRYIGRCTSVTPPNRYKGLIDEVRYWNCARNCDQIQQARTGELTGAEDNLVAYYSFNQGVANSDNTSMTEVVDMTGHGHNGALSHFDLTEGNSASNWTNPGGVTSGVLAPEPQFAEINLKGNNTSIAHQDTTPDIGDHTDFGGVSEDVTRTFTIENSGNIDLTVSDITFSGVNSDDFELGGITFPAVIAANTSTTFTITAPSTDTVTRKAAVSIINDDCDESPYEFCIQSIPPIEIDTSGGSLVVTDPTAAGGELIVREALAGFVQFVSPRAFVVDGGAPTYGESIPLPLHGVAGIAISGSGGDDTITLQTFSVPFPTLAITSVLGEDVITFAGDLDFAPDAGLQVDVSGSVIVGSGAHLAATGAGSIAITATRSITVQTDALVATVDGALALHANQQETATSGDFVGIAVSGGSIQSTGSGPVNLKGRGGDAAKGVQVGVRVLDGGSLQTHLGALTVHGAGGASSGTFNYGVQVNGLDTTISSTGANVTITGVEGTGPSGIAVVANMASSVSTLAAEGVVTLTGNSMLLDNTTSITAPPAGSVALLPFNEGVAVCLGVAKDEIGGPLNLTNAELERITAGVLKIGGSETGDLKVLANILRGSETDIVLTSGADIAINATLDSAGGDVHLAAAGAVTAGGTGRDIGTGDAGRLSIGGSGSLAFAINSRLVNSGYHQLNVAGIVDLTGCSLALNGAYVPLKGQQFILINNDGTDAVVGAFTGLAEGALVTFNGVQMALSYTGGDGNDVTLGYAAPSLTVAKTVLTATEGVQIANSGTLLDLQGNVTLAANIGVPVNLGNGKWTWSGTLPDGPAAHVVTITATDDSSPPLTGAVSFSVTVKNAAPSAVPQTVTVAEDATAFAITLAGTDPGADTLTYEIVSPPAPTRGSLGPLTGNVVHFTPAPDVTGKTTFSFKVTDSDGAVGKAATVTINVTSENDPPIFVKGANRIHPKGTTKVQSFSRWATGISDGDAELKQSVVFTVAELGDSGIFTTLPTVASNGTLTFQPNGSPGTATLSVILTDSGGAASAPQTFTITTASFGTGVYTGLAEPAADTTPGQDNLGLFSATLTAAGGLSAKVNFGGVATAFTTAFSLNSGKAVGSKPTLSWDLELDVMGGTDTITGSISRITDGVVTDVCTVHADRATFSAANLVPSQFLNSAGSGVYTMVFAAKDQGSTVEPHTFPQGDGFGRVILSSTGKITLSGALADGTAITASAPLSKAFQWPLAALIRSTSTVTGMTLGGWVQFDPTAADSDLSAADLRWFRPAHLTAKNYKPGWPAGITVDAVGALYNSATTVQTTLGLGAKNAANGNAQLSFLGGKLTSDIIKTEFNIIGNVVTKIPATNTSFTLAPAVSTGIFTGTFVPNWPSPAKTKPSFRGVLIQKGGSKGGYGYFLSNASGDTDPESGAVALGAQD